MKYIINYLFSYFLFLSFFTVNLNAEDVEKSFKVSRGDLLNVSLTSGNISVTVWEKDQAQIKVKEINSDELKYLKIEQQNNRLIVEFEGKDSDQLSVELSIPESLNLDFATGGGNISVSGNITGVIELSTGGGNIKLNDAGNKLSISTGGGNITVGNSNGETKISTGGGNISIKDVKMKLEVSTGGGNIAVGNVSGTAEVSTAGGNISVGSVSGNAELSTAGGNINVNGATGKIEVSTAGGNLSLKNISGSVDANTAGGNIYADLTPQANTNSELNTAGGDITLELPSDAKATIEATVYAGKNPQESDADKLIRSDFKEATVNFQNRNLVKTFILNGGGSRIELNTASGKIKINKK